MTFHVDIGGILTTVVTSLYSGDNAAIGKFALANAADAFNRFSLPADIKTLLTQASLLVSLVFVGILAYVAVKRRMLAATVPGGITEQVSSAPAVPDQGMTRQRWSEITSHLDSARENDWKLAVVEADKLADDALQKAGFAGETFGDRLSNIQPGTLLSLDGLWWAHRIRNRVAHEMDYFLRYTEARQAISYYEATLSELSLL